MFEIDKMQFGKFIAERRKEKGYTQKTLAQKLCVSDKAVSKWETGNSLPDVSLLIPLAELLEVTVTELLEGQKLQNNADLSTGQVETLVKKVLTFSEESPEKSRKKKRLDLGIYIGSAAGISLFLVFLHLFGVSAKDLAPNFYSLELLSMLIGAYFWVFVRSKLPTYFDEQKISTYSDGFFRMNLPGIHFNNSNWPHIIYAARVWSVCWMTAYPIICLCGFFFFGEHWSASAVIPRVMLILFLSTLFIPLIIVGKKYE